MPLILKDKDSITKEDLIMLFEEGELKGRQFQMNGYNYNYCDGWLTPVTNPDNCLRPEFPGLLAVRYLDDGANVSIQGDNVVLYTSESERCTGIKITYTRTKK